MSRLPLIALPFLADGAFVLYGKLRERLLADGLEGIEMEEDEPVE